GSLSDGYDLLLIFHQAFGLAYFGYYKGSTKRSRALMLVFRMVTLGFAILAVMLFSLRFFGPRVMDQVFGVKSLNSPTMNDPRQNFNPEAQSSNETSSVNKQIPSTEVKKPRGP